ncbi:hypothetical protein m4_igs_764 [Acanthamoeba polyphaga mimivirus]|nr:hypothetical protein m4_igs_764 [Acanthamoeba polyphaga mimivirus]
MGCHCNDDNINRSDIILSYILDFKRFLSEIAKNTCLNNR